MGTVLEHLWDIKYTLLTSTRRAYLLYPGEQVRSTELLCLEEPVRSSELLCFGAQHVGAVLEHFLDTKTRR